MAFGLAKKLGELTKAWTQSIGNRVQPKLYALCPGCGRSSIRFRKVKHGKKRNIVCGYCGHVSQSWTVGEAVPAPKGV